MPGLTPNRHYPFPYDHDPINVAWDMELLARAVDNDVNTGFNQIYERDTAQDIRIDTAAARIEAGFQQIYERDNAQDVRLNIHEAILNLHEIRLNEMSGGLVYHAENVLVTTDVNGFASVFFPADLFAAGSSPVVHIASQHNSGGDPANWVEGQVAAVASNGFGSQWMQRNTNNPIIGAALGFGYIAMGPGT